MLEVIIFIIVATFFIGPWVAVAWGFYMAATSQKREWKEARLNRRGVLDPHEATDSSGWGQ